MIYINIYLENKDKLLHQEKFEGKKLHTIEDARNFCLTYLKEKYNETKYRVQLQPKKT